MSEDSAPVAQRQRRTAGSLAAAISKLRVNAAILTPADLQQLALDVILDSDFEDDTAAHSRVQLEALKLIHQIMQDSKSAEPEKASNFQSWVQKLRGQKPVENP